MVDLRDTPAQFTGSADFTPSYPLSSLLQRSRLSGDLPLLSQAVGYAASALGLIAAAGGQPVLVKDIASKACLPAPYLAKIIQSLARRGIVNTQRGIGGGVTLARPAEKIRLHDLCVALDDPAVLDRCMLGTAECSDARACPAHQFWTAQRATCQEFIRAMTVADIAAFDARRQSREKPIGLGTATLTRAGAALRSATQTPNARLKLNLTNAGSKKARPKRKRAPSNT